MFIAKDKPGSCPGFTWNTAGEGVEVPDALGRELLAIPDGGFAVAEAPKATPVDADEPKTRKRTPVSE